LDDDTESLDCSCAGAQGPNEVAMKKSKEQLFKEK